MNDNVRKVFDMLGVEPGESFRIKGDEKIYYCDETLSTYGVNGVKYVNMLAEILNGTYKIIKIPKYLKKLRDLTPEEWDKWQYEKCNTGYLNCYECIFRNVYCSKSSENCSWVNNKDLYSDKFLDQEIEVEE